MRPGSTLSPYVRQPYSSHIRCKPLISRYLAAILTFSRPYIIIYALQIPLYTCCLGQTKGQEKSVCWGWWAGFGGDKWICVAFTGS